ncbi:hypothetical protein niasHT_012254 [Heterodera trifolii]|uniref:Uncharacterized protein n=1 Tax=Heterodera trifolii TaxID=157864 RepID=A0ABD2KY20_9BILA
MHASHVVIVPSATDVPKLFQLMGVAPFAVGTNGRQNGRHFGQMVGKMVDTSDKWSTGMGAGHLSASHWCSNGTTIFHGAQMAG